MRLINYPDDMLSKFQFIAIASQRCRQLQKGARPRIQSRSRKFTTVAQEEVLAARVEHFTRPKDAAVALPDEARSLATGD